MLNKDITTRPGAPTPKGVTAGHPGSPKGAVQVPKTWWQRYGRLVIAGSVAFLLLLAVTVYALIPDTRPCKFGEVAPELLRREVVQTELNLSDEQKEKAKLIRDEMRAALASPETKVLALPERTKRENYLHRVAAKGIAKTLDAAQMTRLKQLYLQDRRERSWVDDDEVARALKLTKTQIFQVTEVQKNDRGGRGGFPGGNNPGGNNPGAPGGNNPGGRQRGGNNPGAAPVDPAEREKQREEMRARIEEARKKREESYREILTGEQQLKWDEMLGEELKGLRDPRRGGFVPGGQGAAPGDPAAQGQRGQRGQRGGGQPPAGQPPAGGQPPAPQPPAQP